jgi:4-azaleucine resistance transporter AzlC
MQERSLPAAFTAGVARISPVILGIIPFGLIAGVAASEAGFGPLKAAGMSTIVFAGASQLAALDLITQDARIAVIVLTALVINSRMIMYSASLAPHLRGVRTLGRLGLAYVLTDQSYAVCITEYTERPTGLRDRVAFYLGTAAPLWITWQTCTLIGVVLGTSVPPEWSLDYAVPLVFLSLLVLALRDLSTVTAALVSALVVVVGADLPYQLALPVAAVCGILAGVVSERLREA